MSPHTWGGKKELHWLSIVSTIDKNKKICKKNNRIDMVSSVSLGSVSEHLGFGNLPGQQTLYQSLPETYLWFQITMNNTLKMAKRYNTQNLHHNDLCILFGVLSTSANIERKFESEA